MRTRLRRRRGWLCFGIRDRRTVRVRTGLIRDCGPSMARSRFGFPPKSADGHLGRLPWWHQARNFVISDALKIDLLKAVEKTRRKVHVRRGIHSLNGPPSSLKQPEVASLTARAICLRRLFLVFNDRLLGVTERARR